MKIAGRKNDGAWFRTNKKIRAMAEGQRPSLSAAIEALDNWGGYNTAINDLAALAGTSVDTILGGAPDYTMADRWSESGIPRQVWFGVLSYDTYSKGTDGKYFGDHAETARLFGIEIRQACKMFFFAQRQALDITNIVSQAAGNPGGIADAKKD